MRESLGCCSFSLKRGIMAAISVVMQNRFSWWIEDNGETGKGDAFYLYFIEKEITILYIFIKKKNNNPIFLILYSETAILNKY